MKKANKKSLIFSGVFLYLNDERLHIDNFQQNLPTGSYTNNDDSKVQIFNIEYEESYLKMNFGEGMVGPRNPNVYNFNTNEEEPNPRQKNQVEPRQTFAIIDFKTSFLWISNSKKRTALIELFKRYFPTSSIVIKEIYDETQFIEMLKTLDNIKISAVPNLFSDSGLLSKILSEEINGYEASVATLSLSYNNRLTNNYLIDKVKSIFKQKNSLRSIVISGKDENNLGMLFNTEGFSRKIDIEALVDEDEMFSSDDVYNILISKVKNENT
ncbi:hypothetical protein [Flavobacterium xueshanense]|uniref:Uncharacterized protein n=1 Tax=Flavobacterium xueshanense TaxID=935223 RepID=A0A1I1Z3C0_9FLAO|nr:hypothetical protein [Flavobacterium xueshanense]SFE26157.1 hypothetical protein SAMN04488131_101228 [Flavobacterium xueshanense]